MSLQVRSAVRELPIAEPARTHARALSRRLALNRAHDNEPEDPRAWTAGIEYLAIRVTDPSAAAEDVAARHGIQAARMLIVLDALRERTEYRAYVGEWIRNGSPAFEAEPQEEDEPAVEWQELEVAEGEIGEVLQLDLDDSLPEWPVEPQPTAPRPQPIPFLPYGEVPSRWKAPFLPYVWQRDAAKAWEENDGRGIMQVVTGAGKTALALYLYARLVDRLEAAGDECQLIIVVPRIELAKQWVREIRRILHTRGLRIGQYHSESKCHIAHQDIVVITQDSARGLLPRTRMDRPVMLVADECHRLGAPGASRLLEREYAWTLGLSATPERSGDLGFEEVLVPRIGPVVWKYGYREAVKDGIIARFEVLRVKVTFTVDEQAEYDEQSKKAKRILDSIKADYPVLYRTPSVRFMQVLGSLKQRYPHDDRFDMWQAATSLKRDTVHFAAAKYDAVRRIATAIGHPRRVLCFHERIEAAHKLLTIVSQCGRRTSEVHSQVPEPKRSQNLDCFRDGQTDWLIACKSLDEGLDIPAVDTIVIAAGTKGPRQLIQRLGRALRKKDTDLVASVIIVEVAGVDDGHLDQEGLIELREAAEAVREITVGDLPTFLSRVASQVVVPVLPEPIASTLPAQPPKVLPPAKPAVSRPPALPSRSSSGSVEPPGLLVRIARRILPRSWTGTPGSHSYYDKDSSPD